MFIFDFLKQKFSNYALKKWVEESEKEEVQELDFTNMYQKSDSTTIFEKNDTSNQFPISKHPAFLIANKDQNLKTDFCKNDNRHINYLSFDDYKINLTNYNNETHWHIKITKGNISWIDDYQTLSDGFLGKEDFKKLQCLVNTNTGKYLYFPQT